MRVDEYNYVREEDAKNKYCPFMAEKECFGFSCMAWIDQFDEEKDQYTGLGRCGMLPPLMQNQKSE